MFTGLDAMHRFHIGSRAAFGSDISALQQALRQFHRCYFRAPNLTLWLRPTIAGAAACAQRYGSRLPSGSAIPQASPPLTAAKDYTLSLPGTPQLRLVFALPCSHARGWLRRLERLLLDEAPAGWPWLRAQAWCDAVRLNYSRCSENNALLSFIFTVNHGSVAEAAHIESALLAWLLRCRCWHRLSLRITSGWPIAISTVWRRSISCAPERLGCRRRSRTTIGHGILRR